MFLQFIRKFWKETLILVLGVLLFLGARNYESIIKEKQELITKLSQSSKEVDIIEKIVEKRPDGTIIVKDKSTKSKEKSTTKEDTKLVQKETINNKKSYAVWGQTPVGAGTRFKDITVGAGVRVLETPIWVDLGYRSGNSELVAGLRFEF